MKSHKSWWYSADHATGFMSRHSTSALGIGSNLLLQYNGFHQQWDNPQHGPGHRWLQLFQNKESKLSMLQRRHAHCPEKLPRWLTSNPAVMVQLHPALGWRHDVTEARVYPSQLMDKKFTRCGYRRQGQNGIISLNHHRSIESMAK